ncbi:hypothetical protein RPE78_12265 [Thioclava litoralis]|uniref:Uncharacterized protein n=1 Tax=Thioclava litoralis TaxID=3076557 RepID=A0ABZ1DXD0_9RHOB|nr:hypothetical protein RPE78_12265 [Thioclava sp. FTW29]
MDSAEQANGEKRVQAMLIEPLLRQGLAKPSTLTKAGFEEMQGGLRERLAYMSELSLSALAEQVAANPGGKAGDRFPIAVKILEWAAEIQPPSDDGSPLLRAVFANGIGQEALRDGWAPELRFWLKQNRRWPNAFVASQLREQARENLRRLTVIEENLAADRMVSDADLAFRQRRRAAMGKCETIARLAEAEQ